MGHGPLAPLAHWLLRHSQNEDCSRLLSVNSTTAMVPVHIDGDAPITHVPSIAQAPSTIPQGTKTQTEGPEMGMSRASTNRVAFGPLAPRISSTSIDFVRVRLLDNPIQPHASPDPFLSRTHHDQVLVAGTCPRPLDHRDHPSQPQHGRPGAQRSEPLSRSTRFAGAAKASRPGNSGHCTLEAERVTSPSPPMGRKARRTKNREKKVHTGAPWLKCQCLFSRKNHGFRRSEFLFRLIVQSVWGSSRWVPSTSPLHVELGTVCGVPWEGHPIHQT